MIEITLKPRRKPTWFTRLRPRQRVLAVFAFRYDAHLVPDLIANISPLVDGWVSLDDRSNPAAMSTDPARRLPLIEAAHQAGANWILAVDPDERFENDAARRMAELTAIRRQIVWGFNLREMYTPERYRIDGIWGRKMQYRLFPVSDELFRARARGRFSHNAFHVPWHPSGYKLKNSGLNLYHLKMIDPNRRRWRRDLYNALDPERKYQKIGYDYLADEDDAQFETIPQGREYRPPHIDDGGLWMAETLPTNAARE